MLTRLITCLAVALTACGGGGDDPPPTQPPPAPPGPTTVILADSTVGDTQTVQGPSVASYRVGFAGPAYRLPAGAISAEACADVRWHQEIGAPAVLELATEIPGLSPGGEQPGAAIDMTGPGAAMLATKRCGAIDLASPAALGIGLYVTASNPAMYRYTVTVRWVVKARLS